MGSGRYRRIITVEETVLQPIEDNTATSTIAVEHVLDVSSATFCRTLNEEEIHQYHLQRVQPLKPGETRSIV